MYNHQVCLLSLGESGLSGTWNPLTNDIDFIIEFQSMSPGDLMQRYFSLLEDLEDLLGHPIDLIELGAVTSPHLRKSFLEHRNRCMPSPDMKIYLYDLNQLCEFIHCFISGCELLY